MFKIVILQVVVAVAIATPIYPGGMGYGGIGTSSVSVRRTQVMSSPGIGMMGPGMGMGTMMGGVYGGMLAKSVVQPESETTITEEKEISTPEETISETVVEKEVEGPVELMKNVDIQAPMEQMRSGVVGEIGMGDPGMVGGVGVGAVSGSSRTDVVRAGIGGVSKSSVGESHVATPFGSESSVSSVQERRTGLL